MKGFLGLSYYLFNCIISKIISIFYLQSTIDDLKQAIHMALEAGYRHIDTAYLYRNESIIGDVLQDWFERGRIRREEIFITTKVKLISISKYTRVIKSN